MFISCLLFRFLVLKESNVKIFLLRFATVNLKGSSGGIDFDHEDGKLNLIVQKDSTNEQSQQDDVKALSGGERSFT